MMGIFSKFSSKKIGHRRTQSAIDERELVTPSPDAARVDVASSGVAHGIEVAMEFKPVEHPKEPVDNDRPIECPLPEPSILNDGRIWKERVSAASTQRTTDLPNTKEGSAGESRSQPAQSNGMLLPSISAPETNILKLLDECNASGT